MLCTCAIHVPWSKIQVTGQEEILQHVQKLSTSNCYIKPTVYSIRDTNITKIVRAIFDSFFQVIDQQPYQK